MCEATSDNEGHCDEYSYELSMAASPAQHYLEQLRMAASMAQKVAARYDCAVSQGCVEEFLEAYDDLLDPEGVKKRKEGNRVVEEEARDVDEAVYF